MCSGQSVSGSSLLSDDDDARETSGRSRREFDEIDAVLFDELLPKRTSYRKIYDEWSAKPHFRIRGKMCEIETIPLQVQLQQQRLRKQSQDKIDTEYNKENMSTPLSDISAKFSVNDLNDLSNLDDGRSSIDSIEGSELTNSDLDDQDDEDVNNKDQFADDIKSNSFSTNGDDDEDSSQLSNRNLKHQRRKQQQLKPPPSAAPPIKCLKDSIVSTLANLILKQFFNDYQPLLNRYAKLVCQKNGTLLTPSSGISTTTIDRLPRPLRPYSLPPRSLSQNRLSLPTSTSITTTTLMNNNSIVLSNTQDLIKGLRLTPDPSDISLTGLLRVTPCRLSNVYQSTPPTTNTTATSTNSTTSPRKPPERILTSSAIEKRQPQINLISMIGTAVGSLAGNSGSVINIGNNLISLNISNNPSSSSTTALTGTLSSSNVPSSVTTIATLNTSSSNNSGSNVANHRAWPSAASNSSRYRSATLTNDMRLPPITVEPLKVNLTSEQLLLHRSNPSLINSTNNNMNVGTITLISNNNNSGNSIIDRAVSGTSTGSNLSFGQTFPLSNNNSTNLNNKLRTSNVLKFSARTLPPGDFVRGRPIEAHITRPVASAKDSILTTTTNLPTSTSPNRSATRGSNSSNSRQNKLNNNTRPSRQQQQFSTPIKISTSHM
ncbi:unnamed protein product [Didymodactylos carnosus]|uniref:Uncharacterized protein n=1 Tax=Didymodactylos carnosus TaxID=1234261 RepID=A0A814EYI5_9BILA|nr:unnamed protein product [Didymodactylos carnosus]CAF0973912.1 unnamed protein product [Didymodactylos carnosus]CAF3579176.1 unnamed protein product [Didymodactylos carnosus]CAF3746839.1 unnamed protein product [Didymodactylos carnosus]